MKKTEKIILENQLVRVIEKMNLTKGKVALVGGHYMLLYEKKSDSLKPAIYQEFEDWGNMTFSKKQARNFPVKSFEMTVRLYYFFSLNKVKSKCVLLVNDDSFLRKDFRNEEHYESIKERGGELRKKYFSTDDHIPYIFKRLLIEFRIKAADFFHHFEIKDYVNGLMPKTTIFVSERKLCKSFHKTVRSSKVSDDLFRIINIDTEGQSSVSELTVQSSRVRSVCLIEKGVCNCGGKAFQFYLDLIEQGFDTIIFFVPEECKEQVEEGADLFIHSPRIGKRELNIINIMNIENNPDNPVENKEILMSHYSTQGSIARKQT